MLGRKYKIAVLSAVFAGVMACSSDAMAEGVWGTGWYLKGEIGASISTDEVFAYTSSGGRLTEDENVDSGNGAILAIGIGRQVGDFRLEGSFSYREFERNVDTVFDNGALSPGVTHKADLRNMSVFGDIAYDFFKYDINQGLSITPYLSGGVGLAFNRISDLTETSGGTSATLGNVTSVEFAYRLGGGVGVQVTERAIIDIGYKYSDFGRFETNTKASNGNRTRTPYAGDLTAHEVTVGLRYRF